MMNGMKILKKIISLGLCATIALSSVMVTHAINENDNNAVTLDFDEKNIQLSFGALSDIHLYGNSEGEAEKKFERALDLLKNKTSNKLDGVLVAGDMTDYATEAQRDQFKRIFDEKAKANGTELIYALGNHDHIDNTTAADFSRTFGDSYFTKDIDKDQIEKGNRFVELNGYYFIAVEVNNYYNGESCTYNKETKDWLKKKLEFCDKENPNKPIFIATHAMIYDTTYGSTLAPDGPAWYTKDLIPVLENYPQAFVFSGHLHFPLEDERSIMQTDFTSVGCGSVLYMGAESGYTDMPNLTSTVPTDAYNFSQGLLVQVDGNNNTKITRMDFFNNRECGKPWIIPSPNKDKSHLKIYGKDRASTTKNAAPIFDNNEEINAEILNNNQLNISINKATDDQMVHHYRAELRIKNKDIPEKTQIIKTLSGFYRTEMPNSFNFSFKRLLLGETYEIKVFAVDSWDSDSIPLVKEITIPAGEVDDKKLIPDIFNLSFDKDTAVDSSISKYPIKSNSSTRITLDNDLNQVVSDFDGTINSHLSFEMTDEHEKAITKNFSADIIFKADEFTTAEQHIISNNAAGGFALVIPANSEKVALTALVGGQKIFIESIENIIKGKYYRATITYDKEEIILYLNGKEQGRINQKNDITIPKSNKNYFLIGAKPARTGVVTNPFKGSVATVKLYSYSLNRTHVKALIPSEFPNPKPTPEYQIGDVNRDGKITTIDVLDILKQCASISKLDKEQMILANYNKDTAVNTLDALEILKLIAKLD